MNPKRYTSRPYEELFIYYLSGSVPRDFGVDADGFIGNWEENGFSFLFFHKPADDRVNRLLGIHPRLKLLDTFRMAYDQWQGGDISPFRVADFVIAPPWISCTDQGGTPNGVHHILLDPGVVFGNGVHPTTRDCLEAIHLSFSHQVPRRVMDMGTGTGILALAAAKSGASQILAVDINPLCVQTARNNVNLNKLSEKILPIQGSVENFVDYPIDFMIANIHYDAMVDMVGAEGFYRKKGFLLSGLLRSERRAIEDVLIRNYASIMKIWDQNGTWFTILGETQ